jgi:multidrug efflux pump subunit AcrA (membrane-fusion protein)
MGYITTMNYISRIHISAGVLVGALLVLLVSNSVQTSAKVQTEDVEQIKQKLVIAQDSIELPIEVSGVLASVDAITVYARTSGVLDFVYVEEGDVVQAGSQLFKQDTTIVDSAIALATAQGILENTSVTAQYSTKLSESKKADVAAVFASDSTILQADSYNGIKEQLQTSLRLTLEGAVSDLIATLDFIDSNRAFLPSVAADTYTEVLVSLFGQQPSYLNDGLIRRVQDHGDVLESIYILDDDSSEIDILIAADALYAEITKVSDILVQLESEFLDESKVVPSDALYTAYLMHRTGINSMSSEVLSARTALLIQLPQEQKALITATQNDMIADLDAEEAILQTQYAKDVIAKTARVHDAQVTSLLSQKQLAQAYAPFDAVVEKVFVDKGQYIQPGEPVVILQGTGGLELSVTVPIELLSLLEEGQKFVKNGKVLGYVNRFSPTASNGAVVVFISIEENMYVSGQTLSGTLLLDSERSSIIKVPRTYVHFATYGPFVYTNNSKEVPVRIVYDGMENVYIEYDEVFKQGILPVSGITL